MRIYVSHHWTCFAVLSVPNMTQFLPCLIGLIWFRCVSSIALDVSYQLPRRCALHILWCQLEPRVQSAIIRRYPSRGFHSLCGVDTGDKRIIIHRLFWGWSRQFHSGPRAQLTITSLCRAKAQFHQWRRAQANHDWWAISVWGDTAEDRHGARASHNACPKEKTSSPRNAAVPASQIPILAQRGPLSLRQAQRGPLSPRLAQRGPQIPSPVKR